MTSVTAHALAAGASAAGVGRCEARPHGAHAAARPLCTRDRAARSLLGHATESVAEKTGDAVGGLLNAALGNLTELVIATAALHAGQYALVKRSIAGAIVTTTLFMESRFCSAPAAVLREWAAGLRRLGPPVLPMVGRQHEPGAGDAASARIALTVCASEPKYNGSSANGHTPFPNGSWRDVATLITLRGN